MSVTGLLVVVVGFAVVAARALTLWRKRNRRGPAGETRRPPPSPSAPRSEELRSPPTPRAPRSLGALFFAMVFGLAMDYSVFLLAATREQWKKTADPREALIEGMARSGRVIFSAAAVMVAVFFTFAITAWAYPPIEMGAILGFAVIIEATTIRLMLVPVAMRLAGRWAWWIPQPLARRLPQIRWSH